MTSRERVVAALNFQKTDKVPLDFGGHRSSGIAVQAYKKLREYLNLPPSKLYIYDFIQQLAIIEDDVLQIVGADVIELSHRYLFEEDYWKDWVLPDGTPCKIQKFINVTSTPKGNIVYGDDGRQICIQTKDSLYFEQNYFPYADSLDEDFDDLEYNLNQIMWYRIGTPPCPAGYDEAGLAKMRADAKFCHDNTDKAVYAIFGGNLLEMGQFAFRNDNFFCEMLLNPERIHKFLDKLMDIYIFKLDKFIEAVGDYVDIIGFGDDLGMQTGPQISPELYEEFFFKRHSYMWKRVKQLNPRLKTCLHSCGSIVKLIPSLIDAGIDSINPVQINCKDMELVTLKETFGKSLTFWGGGCDVNILTNGTREEIDAHVKQNIDIMKNGGGFIFQQVHNVLANVKPENVMNMFDAVKKYGNL